MGMFNDLPRPFEVGAIKIWPVHSRPEFSWFVAYAGKPFYFKTKNNAILFAMDKQEMENSENLSD